MRSSLLAGPASATFNGHTFFARDGIVITPTLETSPVESDAFGRLDETASEAPVTIRFTPSAPFADLIVLYPHLAGAAGKSLFGPADMPLVLIGANGVRLTFHAVAIMEMPDLRLGAHEAVAGAVTFLAQGARGMALLMANRLVTIDTASIPLPERRTPQLADDFSISWGGAAPWVGLRARNGIVVHFRLASRPVSSDANGRLDLTLEELEIAASFTPATPNGPAEADLVAGLRLQGSEAWPGRLLSAAAQPLVVAGTHLMLTLPLARLVRGGLIFDATQARQGELTFTAGRGLLGLNAPEVLAELTEGLPV